MTLEFLRAGAIILLMLLAFKYPEVKDHLKRLLIFMQLDNLL